MVCVHSRLFTDSTEPVTSDKVVTAVAVESRRIRSLGKMFNFIKMFIKFFVFCFFARCGDVPRIFGGFGINTVSYRISMVFSFSLIFSRCLVRVCVFMFDENLYKVSYFIVRGRRWAPLCSSLTHLLHLEQRAILLQISMTISGFYNFSSYFSFSWFGFDGPI